MANLTPSLWLWGASRVAELVLVTSLELFDQDYHYLYVRTVMKPIK